MKAYRLLPAAALALGIAGCEQPQIVVEVGITAEGSGEVFPLPDLPVRLLPYDREAVLDSLEAASSEPQPPIPPELLAQQQQVQLAQSAWRAAEGRLTSVRDSLRALNGRLAGPGAGGADAPSLRARVQSLEAEEQRVNQEMQTAFAQFDSLQQHTTAATDSIRNLRDSWAQRAFADFNQVIAAKLQQAGQGEHADTTDAGGVAAFRADNGRWWVYARYTLPYEELYWNIPIDATADSIHVELTRENADVRPIL